MAPILLGLKRSAPALVTKEYYPLANGDNRLAHQHNTNATVTDYMNPLNASGFAANYLRFPDVDVPQGAIITEATVSWVVRW